MLRAIVPVAGNGLRLRPITESKSKVLIEVAGRPVLGHIFRNLAGSEVDELVLIVGPMKKSVKEWAEKQYGDRFVLRYVTQNKQLGLGHAIYCAKDFLEGEVLITLGDEIFSRSYASMIESLGFGNFIDASIGIKEVDDPHHYGMIRVDENNIVTEMVEKPSEFDGRLAIAGVYFFKDASRLRDSLEQTTKRKGAKGEYQLTDALQLMVENGTSFSTFSVGEWYDCGRLETLLSSNRRLLERSHYVDESAHILNSEIIEPCYIGPNTRVVNSKIGPNVSMGAESSLESCTLRDAIVETGTTRIGYSIRKCILSGGNLLGSND